MISNCHYLLPLVKQKCKHNMLYNEITLHIFFKVLFLYNTVPARNVLSVNQFELHAVNIVGLHISKQISECNITCIHFNIYFSWFMPIEMIFDVEVIATCHPKQIEYHLYTCLSEIVCHVCRYQSVIITVGLHCRWGLNICRMSKCHF